jgi:hypothetical protein
MIVALGGKGEGMCWEEERRVEEWILERKENTEKGDTHGWKRRKGNGKGMGGDLTVQSDH